MIQDCLFEAKEVTLTPKDVLKEFSKRDNFNMIIERFNLELV